MQLPSAARPYDPAEVRRYWDRSRDLAVLLADETKKPLPDAHRTLIVFSGVLTTSGAVLDLLDDLLAARGQLPEIDRDRSFKSSDLWKREFGSDKWTVVPEYAAYAGRTARFYRDSARIHCVATTEHHLAAANARMTFRDEHDRQIAGGGVLAGSHSVPFVTWLKHVGRTEGFAGGVLSVVVDGSADLALPPGICFRLTALNRRPDGATTQVKCDDTLGLDVFVSGDDHRPFRDALIAPDFLGNLALAKLDGRAPGYLAATNAVLHEGHALHAWAYDLASLLEVQRAIGE